MLSSLEAKSAKILYLPGVKSPKKISVSKVSVSPIYGTLFTEFERLPPVAPEVTTLP